MGTSVTISAATDEDAEQILKLQYLCYQSEAALHGDYGIEPLTQTLGDLRAELTRGCVLVARLGEEVVGSVRGRVEDDGTAVIGKLIVHPRMRRHGLGGRLLSAVEERLARERSARRYRLFTGHRGEGGIRLYRRLGYTPVTTETVSSRLSTVTLEKTPGCSPEGGGISRTYAASA
ncbi:GNAT family N-acetyltransferase [Streptomyces sp. CNQ085]|uniref:GNAT family N-acetyltransferase n=1 Tax=Streptomyces sp. CNQ085 TaxID=2886944 RepID=UPI001F5061B6|nr:GNAT family N-acetyltransferase [Streptomyces sp. CNQ085]MCI0384283.1 GNAT family N-acetyltransferase [Streptomyces sp. CNQ085]